jgi:hypothetical protein
MSAATSRRISRSSRTCGAARCVWGVSVAQRSSAAFRLRAIPTRDGSVDSPGDCGAPALHRIVIMALSPSSAARYTCAVLPAKNALALRMAISESSIVKPHMSHSPSNVRAGLRRLTCLKRLLTIPLLTIPR